MKVDGRLNGGEEERDTGGAGDQGEGDVVEPSIVRPAHADQHLGDRA